jgi:hypothetical protein
MLPDFVVYHEFTFSIKNVVLPFGYLHATGFVNEARIAIHVMNVMIHFFKFNSFYTLAV